MKNCCKNILIIKFFSHISPITGISTPYGLSKAEILLISKYFITIVTIFSIFPPFLDTYYFA